MPFGVFAVTVIVAVAVLGAPPSAALGQSLGGAGTLRDTDQGGFHGQGVQYFNNLDPKRGVYQFGYDTGLLHHQSFREETRTEDGGVRGSFGYVDSGVLRITEYIADHLGYRCYQTLRYLVDPNKGVFTMVQDPDFSSATSKVNDVTELKNNPFSSLKPQSVIGKKPGQTSSQRQKGHRENRVWEQTQYTTPKTFPEASKSRWSLEPRGNLQGVKPARTFGKKVLGYYKDFTTHPAVGGTGAVTSWDSAHSAELTDEEIVGWVQQSFNEQEQIKPTIGGQLVWPTTEDGARVVWHQF